jgi:pimeloyl-ACP methyl ester carboxylesterase
VTGSAYAAAAAYRRAPGPEPAVLMLHGLGGNADQLWPTAGGLHADRLAPDLRGHGRTALVGAAGEFTFAGLAADVAALLRRLGVGPAAVVGVSMGAGVAVALARRTPAAVRALVLIRPAWGAVLPPPNLLPLLEVGDLLRRYGPDAGRARFAATGTYAAVAAVSPAAAASLLAQFDDPDAVRRSVRLTEMPRSAPFPSYRALAELAVPTLVIGAPRDPVHPLALAQEWAAAIPGAELATVPARDPDPTGYQAELTARTAAFLSAGAA